MFMDLKFIDFKEYLSFGHYSHQLQLSHEKQLNTIEPNPKPVQLSKTLIF